MQEFEWETLINYIDPADFQMCEMDTDSSCLAISEENLDAVINLR